MKFVNQMGAGFKQAVVAILVLNLLMPFPQAFALKEPAAAQSVANTLGADLLALGAARAEVRTHKQVETIFNNLRARGSAQSKIAALQSVPYFFDVKTKRYKLATFDSPISVRDAGIDTIPLTSLGAIGVAKSGVIGKKNKDLVDVASAQVINPLYTLVARAARVNLWNQLGEGQRDGVPLDGQITVGHSVRVEAGKRWVQTGIDPVDGTSRTAKGEDGGITVVADTIDRGFKPLPDIVRVNNLIYTGNPVSVDLQKDTPEEILTKVIKANGGDAVSFQLWILNRQHHQEFIAAAKKLGVRTRIYQDGTIQATAYAVTYPDQKIIIAGRVGATEAGISAANLLSIHHSKKLNSNGKVQFAAQIISENSGYEVQENPAGDIQGIPFYEAKEVNGKKIPASNMKNRNKFTKAELEALLNPQYGYSIEEVKAIVEGKQYDLNHFASHAASLTFSFVTSPMSDIEGKPLYDWTQGNPDLSGHKITGVRVHGYSILVHTIEISPQGVYLIEQSYPNLPTDDLVQLMRDQETLVDGMLIAATSHYPDVRETVFQAAEQVRNGFVSQDLRGMFEERLQGLISETDKHRAELRNLQIQLREIVKRMITPNGGILAADESVGSVDKRFKLIDIENNVMNRERWRSMIITTKGLKEAGIDSMILDKDTLDNKSPEGKKLVQVLLEAGIVPGLKTDGGLIPDEQSPFPAPVVDGKPKLTEGEVIPNPAGLQKLAALLERAKTYGVQFTKWRVTTFIDVTRNLPTEDNIRRNMQVLAKQAKQTQLAGPVPILEPEILYEGTPANHNIAASAKASRRTLEILFEELAKADVWLDGIVLKTSMVLPGKNTTEPVDTQTIGRETLKVLLQSVPAEVPAVVFLSGGQKDSQANENLNSVSLARLNEFEAIRDQAAYEIEIEGNGDLAHKIRQYTQAPWELTYSFGRGLQIPALLAWGGKDENLAAAQAASLKSAQASQAARLGLLHARSEVRSVDLTPLLGLPAVFEPSTLAITYGEGVSFLKAWSKTMGGNAMSGDALWKSLKLVVDYTDEQGNVIQQPDIAQFYDPNKILYHGHQGAYWNDAKFQELLKEHQLRPDVTVLPAGFIGDEYLRTEGHHHLSGLPEVYETIYGENGYLLFKTVSEDSEDIADVMFVFAKEGDHVLFPPGYQHISINIGTTPFVMTDWVSTEARSDFKYIKRHNGAPYWVVRGADGQPQFIRNPRYHGKVPEIRLVRPAAEIPEFGLKKGVPMFNLVKEGKIDLLNFLNDTNESGRYDAVYQKAFVPVESRAEVRVGTESVAGRSATTPVRRFIQLPQLNTATKAGIQQALSGIFQAFEESGSAKRVLQSLPYTYQQGTVVDPAILFEGFGDQQDKGYLLGALAIRAVYGNDPVAVPLAAPQEGDAEGLATYKAQLALIGEINEYLVQQGKAKLEVTSSVDQAVKFLKRQGVRKIQAIVGTASQIADSILKRLDGRQIITQQRFQALVSLDARFQGFVEEFKRFYAIARSA